MKITDLYKEYDALSKRYRKFVDRCSNLGILLSLPYALSLLIFVNQTESWGLEGIVKILFALVIMVLGIFCFILGYFTIGIICVMLKLMTFSELKLIFVEFKYPDHWKNIV